MKIQKNFFEEISELANSGGRIRGSVWAKTVNKVDTEKSNGYCFEGEWLPKSDRISEVEMAPGQVCLFSTDNGSTKYHEVEVTAVKLNSAGNFEAIEGCKNIRGRDWALKIREKIAEEVDKFNGQEPESPLAGFTTEDLWAELRRRGEVK